MSNLVKKKIKNKNVSIGCFISFYGPEIVEMIGYSGFDFVVIDNEHGPFSWREVEEMIRACEISGLIPIVRVSSSNPTEILKALDRGAMGIQVPQIKNRQEIEDVIKAVKYPPDGNRGVAYSVRAAKHGLDGGQQHLINSNEDVLIAVQIENPLAIENFKEIVQSNVDLFYIGPTDLSASYGRTKRGAQDAQIQEVIEEVKKTADYFNKPIGIHVANLDDLKNRKEWGASYIGISVNSIINPSLKIYADELKSGD